MKSIATFFAVVLFGKITLALCDCGEKFGDWKAAAKNSKYVFSGKFTSIDSEKGVLKVQRVYRGKVPSSLTVPYVKGDCDENIRNFSQGIEYYFVSEYLNENQPSNVVFRPSTCNRAITEAVAPEVIKWLDSKEFKKNSKKK